MRRTAKIGVGAGVLAGLLGTAKVLGARRPGSRKARVADYWPEVAVKPGSKASIDGDRAVDVPPADGD